MKNINSLRSKRDFDLVFNNKHSKANKYLVIYARSNELSNHRMGISVSKKVGNSVVRHRLARLIRESYRLNKKEIVLGYDFVVIARSSAKDCDFKEIELSFMNLIKKLKLIKITIL